MINIKYSRFTRTLWVILAVILGVFVSWVLAVRYAPPQLLYGVEIHQVEKAVKELEQYKTQHGNYPSESQYRLANDNMFYSLKDGEYEIGFSVGFDEWYSYDSHTRKWSFETQ